MARNPFAYEFCPERYCPTFSDPTWDEMIHFLNHDHTNWNEYVVTAEEQYTCRHFACDVCLAARDQGIRCAYVHIGFRDYAHAIVAFETTDKGMIYFEPQSDRRMKVEIGKEYWGQIYPGSFGEVDIIASAYPYWNTAPEFCEELRK